jgi:hypothetical protein
MPRDCLLKFKIPLLVKEGSTFRRRAAIYKLRRAAAFSHQSGPPWTHELAAVAFLGDELGTQGAPSIQI